MTGIIKLVGALAILAGVIYYFAPTEQRERILQKLEHVGSNAEADDGTPKIVREQQRKERIRQDTTWTAENQALHPIEYCQAKLADLDEYDKRLEVLTHKMMVAKSAATRDIGDNEAMQKNLTNFLATAKREYKESAAAGKERVTLGGFSLTFPKAREKMVEANRKLPYLQERIGKRKNMIVKLDKNLDTIAAEQKRLVEIRERIQHTISDLQLKNVIEGEKGIRDALNAINDSMASLGVDYDDPALSDIVQPSQAQSIDAEFEKLMAE